MSPCRTSAAASRPAVVSGKAWSITIASPRTSGITRMMGAPRACCRFSTTPSAGHDNANLFQRLPARSFARCAVGEHGPDQATWARAVGVLSTLDRASDFVFHGVHLAVGRRWLKPAEPPPLDSFVAGRAPLASGHELGDPRAGLRLGHLEHGHARRARVADQAVEVRAARRSLVSTNPLSCFSRACRIATCRAW